jgi:pyridoxal phosphate enzyme (YggS family)
MTIRDNVRMLLEELGPGIKLVAAAKSRTPAEVLEAVDAGIRIVGENYVQEAQAAFQAVGHRVEWHFIGHLQTNKVKKAVEIFDLIETVDSLRLAAEIDKRSAEAGKIMPVLIEINSGREEQKFGVFPEAAEGLIRDMAGLKNIRVMGLMTMGPLWGDPEEARPYFQETKKAFDLIKELDIPGVRMDVLSMGMTSSYSVAVREGANMVRIGTMIFGPRD